jgi:hypothetical protein
MNALQSLREYERFVYALPAQFATIRQSTLTIQRRGRQLAELRGDILLRNGCRLAPS